MTKEYSRNDMAWPFPTSSKPSVRPNMFDMTFDECEEPQVCHFFNKRHPYGGVSVAFVPETAFKNCRMLRVAVQYCSPNDSFSKSIGGTLVREKFHDGESILVSVGYMRKDNFVYALSKMFGSFY